MFRIAIVGLLHLALAVPALADETQVLTGSVARISSDAWTISGFDSTFELTDTGLSGEFRADRIHLAASGQFFDDIRVRCASITLTTRTVQCAAATFIVTIPGIDRQAIPGAFTYNRSSGAAEIELSSIRIAGASVRFTVTTSDAGIDIRYSGAQLQLAALLDVAANFTDAFADYSAAGHADIAGTLTARPNTSPRIILVANVGDVSLANSAGTIATDSVTGQLDLDITLQADTTRLNMGFTSNKGEAYLEPVYANFSENAVSMHAEDVVTDDFSVFTVQQFHLLQDALLDLRGSTTLRLSDDETQPMVVAADVELRDSSVANLYENLLKISAAGTFLGDLETGGSVSGSVRIADDEPRLLSVALKDTILDDRRGRFAIYGLQGDIDWNADGQPVPDVSRLSWDSGTVYKIIFGAGALNLQLGNSDIELLEPLRLPLLGGALLVNQFALNNFGSDAQTGRLDAELEPIQLGQLTVAFGWPAFSGRLSGKLPLLQLVEDTITVGGTLSAAAFDGTMEVSRLRIEQPFGRVPRMQAELAIRDLDLQRVTEVFSFGLIQGRLSGDVTELVLQNWRPVAMDMSFYTPADDKSQHRISQRAVENLASVGGGGAAAVLSTGFLKFFDVFAYDRIGLRCVLNDGVCTMSGVGPAKSGPQGSGYYIVKGRGIPRIDVVGFRDTVSWPRLVRQLAAITQSGPLTMN